MHKLKHLKNYALLCLVAFATLITPLTVAVPAHASGEQFTWIDSNNIQAAGGDFVGTSVIGEFGPNQDTADQTFFYPAPFDITVQTDTTAPGGDTPSKCRIFGRADFWEPNHLELNVDTGASTGPQGDIPRCSDDYKIGGTSVIDLYNKTFTVSNARPGSGSGTPETSAQKVISTYICNYNKDAPTGIKVYLKNKKGKVVQTITGTGSKPTEDDCVKLYEPSFTDVKPGTYSVCTNLSKDCADNVVKVKYKPAVAPIQIGKAPESGKNGVVEGSLYIDNPDIDPGSLTENQDFGTYTVVLLDSKDKKLKSTSVNVTYDKGEICKKAQDEGGIPCSVPDVVSGYIAFKNVSPGQYKVCVENTDNCKSFTKKYNTRYRNADIHITMEEAKKYDTSGIFNGSNNTSCSVEGIGWIICPVLSFMGKLNDAAFSTISKFLQVEPKLLTDRDTQAAWSSFRDIANVAFVVAFLIIVYSQISGMGISNYGIKRMLPRLFIAAVLVNLSYYVCQIAVDLSNILGGSIYSFFKDMPTTDALSDISANAWQDVTGRVLAGVAIVLVALLALSTISTAALLAFALIILILIARKAALLLLVVISPLAFVAYLLPNTEQWFKKWWKMFSSLLMVFPVVGLIFGASTLAAKILNNAAGGENADGGDQYLLQITALGVMAVPLFAVPLVLKGALSAVGSIGAKLSGYADKAQGAAAARSKKRFSEQAGRLKSDIGNRWKVAAHSDGWLGRSKVGAYSRYKTRRDSLQASRENEAKRSATTYMANQLGETDENGAYTERAIKLQNAAAGGSRFNQAGESAQVRAAAVATQGMHKQFDDDVSAFKTTMTSYTHDQLMQVLKDRTASNEKRAAAAGMIMSRDFREGHLEALEASRDLNSQGDAAMHDVQKQMAHDMKDKPWALGDKATGELVEGRYGSTDGRFSTQTMDEQIKDRVENKLSPANLAKMNPDEMRRIFALSQKSEADGGLTAAQRANLIKSIEDARSDIQYMGLIKPEAQKMHDKILQDAAAATYGPNI